MTIVYFADIRFPLERANGIQTFETCAALAGRGHQVRLVVRPDTARPTRDPWAYYGRAPLRGLVVERAAVSGPALAKRLGYLAFATGRSVGRGRADIVFTRDLGVASLLLHLPPRLRPPIVYESHGYAPTVAAELPALIATAAAPDHRKIARLERREARVWRLAEGYVTITQGLADDLRERFGPRPQLAVVPDGARIGDDHGADASITAGSMGSGSAVHETDDAASARGREAGAPVTARPLVVYAGHLYAWKGVDVLLDALALLPDADALIVGGQPGESDLGRLIARADALGLGPRVRFAGHVPPADVAALLRRATVLALPNTPSTLSASYTSPLKLFEYMAAGRPIVASDLPAIREVLRHEVTGLLVPAGDAAALAAALQRLAVDRDLAARLALAARAAVAEYSWARRAERLEALFTAVTSPDA